MVLNWAYGRAGARSADGPDAPANDDLEALALGGDVRVRTTGSVELALVRRTESGQVGLDGSRLVRRNAEVVREASGGEVGSGLGARVGGLGGTDGGQAKKRCIRYVAPLM